MSKGIRSNSDIFADRGDPWVSEKEGLTGYGRILRTENPDLDQFTRAKMATGKHEMKSEPRSEPRADQKRRVANVMAKMHKTMARIGQKKGD